MKTSGICNKAVITAEASTALIELARLMRSNHVGSVVIVAPTSRR